MSDATFKSFVDRLHALYERGIVVAGQIDEATGGIAQELGVPPMSTYVIAATGSSLVKIGKAQDVNVRRRELQIGSPGRLYVLRTIPFDCEKRMHFRFGHLRRHGEWFEFDIDMLTETFHEDLVGRARAILEAA